MNFITKVQAKYLFEVPEGVDLQVHALGSTLWIDWFHLPPEMRNKGLGKKIFNTFEKSLPKKYKLLKLFAADSGSGKRSNKFWESVGFDYVTSEETGDDEVDWMMQKGINGHPTPKPEKNE